MLEYKGFKISGTSTPTYMEGCESRGSVCEPGRLDLLSSWSEATA
jgi:hypothetical protein